MLIAGASGHAKDLLLCFKGVETNIVFFDDSKNSKDNFLGFTVIDSLELAKKYFSLSSKYFCIATGSPNSRFILNSKLTNTGIGETVTN